ncbi:MAG: AraC family transcriptional regulator [Lachnospiraceae bacterium]|jgi:AraC-like DNA-binding protein|nr:AraC family transcriptional regulator [Lachnospiraceae bacterium]
MERDGKNGRQQHAGKGKKVLQSSAPKANAKFISGKAQNLPAEGFPVDSDGVHLSYKSTYLPDAVSVHRIISVHYFQYLSNFSFPGEKHDFWELVAVDRGVIDAIEDDTRFTMHSGDLLLHRPNVFHNILTNGRISPSLIVISFKSQSSALGKIAGILLSADTTEKTLLAQILIEARALFEGPLDKTYQEKLRFRKDIPFGSAQMLRTSLEQLLIRFCRKCVRDHVVTRNLLLPENAGKADFFSIIENYLNDHISEQLKVEDICRDNMISRTHLQRLFREHCGSGVIKHFITLKIDRAKELIRNRQSDFSQIAGELGYSSLYYFSRQFKQVTTMSPSEYVSSVRSITEKDRPE